MQKIIIDNLTFDYAVGCRILKMKHKDVPFKGLEDVWDELKPMTFEEIARDITNIEQRRVAILYLGMEAIVKEINPILVNTETITKETEWVNDDGSVVRKTFEDTYELYKVEGKVWAKNVAGQYNNRGMDDAFFVKMKDTSTDREYFIWVLHDSVCIVNNKRTWGSDDTMITAIEAVAWTFQTQVTKGNIAAIIRQGDCILVQIKDTSVPFEHRPRHLTAEEYRTLLVAES